VGTASTTPSLSVPLHQVHQVLDQTCPRNAEETKAEAWFFLAAHPNVLQQIPEPQRTASRGSGQEIEGRSTVQGLDRICSCNTASKCQGNNSCHCQGNCQKSITVHKIACNCCNMVCIGNTQQHCKQRMNQHFQEAKLPVMKGQKSDSCASHFAKHFKPGQKPTPKELHKMQTFDIMWQGEPLSVVKSFGTRGCQLCSREKINIVKWSRKELEKLINTCSEICGGCRHKPRLHRCREEAEDTSTDECMEGEGVNLSSNSSTTGGVVTPDKENQLSLCEENFKSLQDVPDEGSPSPKRLPQPLTFCGPAAIWVSHSLLSARCDSEPHRQKTKLTTRKNDTMAAPSLDE